MLDILAQFSNKRLKSPYIIKADSVCRFDPLLR